MAFLYLTTSRYFVPPCDASGANKARDMHGDGSNYGLRFTFRASRSMLKLAPSLRLAVIVQFNLR